MSIIPIVIVSLQWLGLGLVAAAACYACAALYGALKGSRKPPPLSAQRRHAQPVSILKPLHGAEPRLYENLRSFCLQSYPDYQLIFGVREAEDPAIAIVQQLQKEFPQHDIRMVIDSRIYGANLKISNLINMLPLAAHDWMVLADSDISVPNDYLVRVTAPLTDPAVGIVTCLYRGIAGTAFWSRLGRLFIDDWFAPSVRVAHAFGSTRFAFGSTIAMRRDTLRAIGGLEPLRDTLADDFWLGELTRLRQRRTVLSDLVVNTDIHETRLGALWAHEVRWLRTIRAIAPLGFAMMFICFTSPILLLGLCLSPNALTLGLASLGGVARVLLHFLQRRSGDEASTWRDAWFIPLRDGLLLLEWVVALASWQVRWRGQVLHARRGAPAPHS